VLKVLAAVALIVGVAGLMLLAVLFVLPKPLPGQFSGPGCTQTSFFTFECSTDGQILRPSQ
jgi:hypothetical protein